MANKTYKVKLDLNSNLGKLVVLETLIEISRKQNLNPKFKAKFIDQRKTGEHFSDAASFQKNGYGDCAMAVVWAGAILRNKGYTVYPVLERRRINPNRKGKYRLHTVLYEPSKNRVIDPTFKVFPEYRGVEPIRRKLTVGQKLALDIQICKLHGKCNIGFVG